LTVDRPRVPRVAVVRGVDRAVDRLPLRAAGKEPLAAARRATRAVGLAIERFRRCEHVNYDPTGLHEFIVESREPSTQHRLTRNIFDAWLRRPGGSPADVALRTRLKELLGIVA
jgi:hypothetical protein